jgi:hypothetical protein
VLQFSAGSWHRYAPGQTPEHLLAAGRFVWLVAGDRLYRHDADLGQWLEAQGLDEAPTLLAVDAAGTAWVRSGEQTLALAFAPTVRLQGLFEGATVYDSALQMLAALGSSTPVSALHSWLDDGEPAEVPPASGVAGTGLLVGQTVYSLGGLEPSGQSKPVSLAALSDGWHTLSVRATVGELTFTPAGAL